MLEVVYYIKKTLKKKTKKNPLRAVCAEAQAKGHFTLAWCSLDTEDNEQSGLQQLVELFQVKFQLSAMWSNRSVAEEMALYHVVRYLRQESQL